MRRIGCVHCIVSNFSADMVSRLYAIIEIEQSSNNNGNEYSISRGVIWSPVVTSTDRETHKDGELAIRLTRTSG